MPDQVKLQRLLKIKFKNPDLLTEALTHKSFTAEHHINYDNQRLELLGDAVVQIILTRYLYDRYTELHEGNLTKIRSALANQDTLAVLARKIDLGKYLLLGKGEIELNGQDRDSTLSDAFEAFMGALYLDKGLETATEFFLKIMEKEYPDPSILLQTLNPKGALQEYTQSVGAGVPQYRIVSVSGPDHEPIHKVEVLVRQKVICQAEASGRKQAECLAAKQALQILLKKDEETDE